MVLALKDGLRRPLSASINRARAQRILILCAGAMLVAIMVYIAVRYGFDAVVRCEANTYSVLGQDRSAITQIALSSACGF